MARPSGILRQDSRNRRASPLDRGISIDDPQADSLHRLLRRVGEEQQPEATALIETLRQISRSITNDDLAKLVNNYLRSRRSRILSYENFFRALSDFRHKIWNGASLGWRSRTEGEECSPEDYETFDALVELIGKIAEYDESSRLHIADNPDWNHPLHILATLVSCGIPTTMKATILLTLASFAKSTGPATLIWQYMGAVLAPLTVAGPKQGLKLELEEMEVRYREYPVTKAIILLMLRIFGSLSDHALAPDFLQQFQEFTSYIHEAVFSKVDERSFSTPQEHLDVLLSCLQLFEKCLTSLNELSFVIIPALTTHPGYVLRQRILEGHTFFDKLLNWLSVCSEEYDKSHSDGVHRRLEDVVSCILKIFCSVIHNHDGFLNFLKQHDRNASAVGLDTLIATTINNRSARKDFIFTFMKLLKYRSKRLSIAQLALEIISFVTCRVQDHKDWISVLYYDEGLYNTVIANFAGCIVIDPESTQQENRRLESVESVKLVQDALKMILGNLKNCSFPNLAQVLLGFPLQNGSVQPSSLGKNISSAALPRIFELIEPGRVLFELIPTVTETALDILDFLCQKQATGVYVLRYLRNDWAGDLCVEKLLGQLPLVDNGDNATHSLLRHQKAILHIVAKEIRILIDEYMIPSANVLISRLCSFPSTAESGMSTSEQVNRQQEFNSSMACQLLSVVTLSLPPPASVRSLNLEFLDYANVEDALNSSRITTDDGHVLHDASLTLMYLRELLHGYEENGMGRADMVHDFKTICDYIEQETLQVGLIRARRDCYEAWTVLISVIVESLGWESFPFPSVPSFMIQLSALLSKEIAAGMPASEMILSFETVFSLLSAFVRFSGPVRRGASNWDSFNVEGFAMKALLVDYKSVILRTSSTFITEVIGNLSIVALRKASTVMEKQYCCVNLLLLLKWADWDYANYEDASAGYSQSVQTSAGAIRSHVRNAFSGHFDELLRLLLDGLISVNGPREATIVQTLNALWKLFELEGNFFTYGNFSVLSQMMTTLAKDNQKLAQCIAAQTDNDDVLVSFETKMSALISWISSPRTQLSDQHESAPFHTAVQTILLFDVMRALNVIKDARNSLNPVQRAWIAGTSSSVYGYCIRIFRKIVDFLIAVLHQARLRPAFRHLLTKVYQYVEVYGVVLSDFLREPSDTDDPAWDDIDRTVELISLVGRQGFSQKLADPTCTEIPAEMFAIELKLSRLLQNLNTLVLPPPKGNYKDYYQSSRRRSRSLRLTGNLLRYLRQIVFDGSGIINANAIRPVFARSNVFGRKELTVGTVTLSYGDLLEHIRSFGQAVLDRLKVFEDIRMVGQRNSGSISESDLKLVLDSDLLPARREDRENFYRLFIKEQECDIMVEVRQLLNIEECLLMILVTHLEHVCSVFLADAQQTPLPASMRRALLPALEQEMPTTPYDEYRHFKTNVREFITDDFLAPLADLYKVIGGDNNKFLGLYLGRLMDVVELASS
ncbi:LOW QUALITY PROTEIN: uncharacterized protein LOC129580928 [Paramacrobiotus metropolitanus]|uniref:LOW QUALITY PROTEIN: uncharacterized protein LOC129580928 n=1 Tax=Paramacrobiotus metropolitanus TaxID=2943436 RepID=UPI002445C606|nr:LOW QUALITY PROTEIN: uncharacterized protein LOC129580928 [Paramacrobiotus metropolitanus]